MDNTIFALSNLLDAPAKPMHRPYIIFLSGASGAGKTHLLEACQQAFTHPQLYYEHFDNIGVPTIEVMHTDYGSPEGWQAAMTYEWVRRFKEDYSNKTLFIFEGQYNFDFALKACDELKINNYQLILVTVPEAIRVERLLHLRQQPELVNEHMNNWAKFLENQAKQLNLPIIDTSALTTPEAVRRGLDIAVRLFQKPKC